MDSKNKIHPSEHIEFITLPRHLTDQEESSIDNPSVSSPRTPCHPSLSLVRTTTDNNKLHRDLIASVPGFPELAREAKEGTSSEHQMSLWQGIKLYPKAIAWCCLLSLTIVMEGFDVTLVLSFFAFPEFRERYGSYTETGGYQISPSWQSALSNGAIVGEIIGLLFNGLLTDRFGNRKVLIASLGLLAMCTFLAFFAQGVEMLLLSQLLCGIPWGVFQTLSTTYAAEVMPVALRAYLTSNINLCWLVGQLISVGTLRGMVSWESEWSYRIPFALQWAWVLPILAGVLFAPESPWWLIQHEKPDQARKALLRLTTKAQEPTALQSVVQLDNTSKEKETETTTQQQPDTSIQRTQSQVSTVEFDVDQTIAMMKHTNEVEKYLDGGRSYLDCFRGPDLRRTEIACVVWITQCLCALVIGNATYFYEQAGLESHKAFDLSISMYAVGIFGGVCSWALMKYFGRRTLYLWGVALCAVILFIAGIVGLLKENEATGWILGSLIIVETLVYNSTVGPVAYALVAEIPATRLRVKTVVLGRVAYNVATLAGNVLISRMLNPNAWDWKGKSCFVWTGPCFLCFVWCYFRLPEPKGLTYLELDILFQKNAGARKFSKFRGKLAQTGYFSLCKGNDVKEEGLQWGSRRS